MNTPFTPLVPQGSQPARPSDAFRLQSISQSVQTQPFKPLVAVGPNGLPDMAGIHPAQRQVSEPVITVQREGERITQILVQCPCGHVVELACTY